MLVLETDLEEGGARRPMRDRSPGYSSSGSCSEREKRGRSLEWRLKKNFTEGKRSYDLKQFNEKINGPGEDETL
ncbi:MAG: hypothetical protein IPL83_07880 [Bdellovibrionales bacterium]|nr:hypothetical protein [Bdellovibrionales bacterium]